jgi:long-chain acyl-CoA synthetase
MPLLNRVRSSIRPLTHFFTHASTATPPAMPLGYSLPDLLNAACEYHPNPTALNQWTEQGWQSYSTEWFRDQAAAVAQGLLSSGLEPTDRVAFLLSSDVSFALADMGCLLARLVTVPIDLTQTIENVLFMLRHSEAKLLMIANLDLLRQIAPYLEDAPQLRQIVVIDLPESWQPSSETAATPPSSHPTIPETACLDPASHQSGVVTLPASLLPSLSVMSLHQLLTRGQQHSSSPRADLRFAASPQDLATILYIPGETGELLGVMLTHENLSANALASFSCLPDIKRGAAETVLSFLPLTHVFARGLFYGHLYYGHSIYFSNSHRVLKHFGEIRPTIFATVPLLLEKIYSKILERGEQAQFDWQRRLFAWAVEQSQRFELGCPLRGRAALSLWLANRLVLRQWRQLFGGRLKYLLSGGAALSPELANGFGAAGVTILQGYGLTQAGGVVCCNRSQINRAGTVGLPIPGMEVMLADDGEVLIRGASVTPGYYRNPAATVAAIDAQGWFHTGDLGQLTSEGLLQITGLKKALFKLSTGKYIAPRPIEARLMASPLVAQAVVVGAERRFCAALIMPNWEKLNDRARAMGIDLSGPALLDHPCILALYQAIVESANCHLPYWAVVKRFRLLPLLLDDQLPSTHQLQRAAIATRFAQEIAELYLPHSRTVGPQSLASEFPEVANSTCPPIAQSLNLRFTT